MAHMDPKGVRKLRSAEGINECAFRAKLDAYSRVAYPPIILARSPEWESLAQLRPRPDGVGSTVDFNIPCPSPAVEQGLWVSTADEEFTVGFHMHHVHFTEYENPQNVRQIEEGIQYALSIIEERIGVVSWYRRGAFMGSISAHLPHPDPLPGLYDSLGPTAAKFVGNTTHGDRAMLRHGSGASIGKNRRFDWRCRARHFPLP